jgi:zinc/manganese transport system ATP-binding protein
MGPAIEMSGGAVRLGGRTIWSDVDVSVAEGDFVAILGPNGAGKSTLLNVLLGLTDLAAGSASVLGGPVGAHNEQIGYLPQRRVFDSATRVRGVDLVRLGLDGRRWGVPLPLPARFSASSCGRRSGRSAARPTPIGRSGSARAESSSACLSPRRSCEGRGC